jgi:hypothetical protein
MKVILRFELPTISIGFLRKYIATNEIVPAAIRMLARATFGETIA